MSDSRSTHRHESLTEKMRTLIERWESTGDRRAVFLSCYRLMTTNMLEAIAGDEFFDTVWVYRLLQRFAGYYFAALNAYEDQAAAAPPVWQAAFAGAAAVDKQALQILLLGVNAHINYDLVLTLVEMLQPEWETMPTAQRAQRYADYCCINDVIGRTIDAVQDEIIEPDSPAMDAMDMAFGPLDEWLTSRLITHWREEVWQNALQWLESDEEQHEALRRRVETATLKRADAIQLDGGFLTLRHLV